MRFFRIANKMKRSIMNRIASLLLCRVIVFALLPTFGINRVHAATTSQNNIVARADYMYNITWTPKSTVYGWNYNYTFYAGNTYRIPYGQPINSGAYIGYGVSSDSSSNNSSSTVTGGYATVSNNSYVLDGSAVDDKVAFDKLPAGEYTYVISVTYESYYADSTKTVKKVSGTRTLKKVTFEVV